MSENQSRFRKYENYSKGLLRKYEKLSAYANRVFPKRLRMASNCYLKGVPLIKTPNSSAESSMKEQGNGEQAVAVASTSSKQAFICQNSNDSKNESAQQEQISEQVGNGEQAVAVAFTSSEQAFISLTSSDLKNESAKQEQISEQVKVAVASKSCAEEVPISEPSSSSSSLKIAMEGQDDQAKQLKCKPDVDIFGHSSTSKKHLSKLYVNCPNCTRKVHACRFVFHVDRCMSPKNRRRGRYPK